MRAARLRATPRPERADGLRTDRAQVSPGAPSYTRRTVRPHPLAVREHPTGCRSFLTSFLRSVGRSRTYNCTATHHLSPSCRDVLRLSAAFVTYYRSRLFNLSKDRL